MTVPELYRTWAPPESPWSPWVKPVLFAGAMAIPLAASLQLEAAEARIAQLPPLNRDTFVIVDLQGPLSVAVGIALAQRRLRPIPLFNGVHGEPSLVPVGGIVHGLVAGAEHLTRAALPADAPPAFLLDAERMSGYPAPGLFDNRWVVVPEDFPSANLLLAAGHSRAIVIADTDSSDLPHVLLRYARAGIRLLRCEPSGALVPHQAKRPSWFGSVFARAMVMAGLRRSSAGGFGALVPIAAQTGTG